HLGTGHAASPPSRGRLNRSVRSSGLILDAAFGCHESIHRLLRLIGNIKFSASHAARCVACHGVRSHPVPVALAGESATAPSSHWCRTRRDVEEWCTDTLGLPLDHSSRRERLSPHRDTICSERSRPVQR